MATYKTPGVYVEEIAKFPPSVAQVETAIPAFIGFTEFAKKVNGDSLHLQPKRITSLLEYETFFGLAQAEEINVDVSDSTDEFGKLTNRIIKVHQPESKSPFLMYYSMQMYFANGGGPCYIVSVGQYGDGSSLAVDLNSLDDGLKEIQKVDEPTLLLFPDSTSLPASSHSDFYSLMNSALAQCNSLQDRFTIMDTFSDKEYLSASVTYNPIDEFRNQISSEKDFAKYGAVYYPFLETILNYRYNESSVKINHTTTAPDAVPFALAKLNTLSASVTSLVNGLRNTPLTPAGKLVDVINFLNANNKFDLDAVLPDLPKNFDAATRNEFLVVLKPALTDLKNLVDAKASISKECNSVIASISEDATAAGNLTVALATFTDNFESSPNKIEETYTLLSALYDKLLKDNTPTKIANSIHVNTTSSSNVKTQIANLLALGVGIFTTDALGTVVSSLDSVLTLVNSANSAGIDVDNGEMNGRTLADITNLDNASFNKIKVEIDALPLTLPPSSAVAGIYARIDKNNGVWKAPANVNLAYVSKPTVNITHEEQADMNVHTTGKSVNAIRTFTGKGTMVWGARTLAGNDNEWRYVPVRRFFNMVEESVKKASEQFVFEGNDANTWVRIRAMIENFLNLQWRAGALTGAKPEQAYYVRVGLGQTMTAEDILNGYMNIEIGMAVVRPAEFIVLKFSHKMQEA